MGGCLQEAKKGPIKLVTYLKNVIFATVESKIFLCFELYAKMLGVYCEI